MRGLGWVPNLLTAIAQQTTQTWITNRVCPRVAIRDYANSQVVNISLSTSHIPTMPSASLLAMMLQVMTQLTVQA